MTSKNNSGNMSLVGNGRRLRLACNSGRLFVVGNGTNVVVERNDGEIRVVGNHGSVAVARNSGVVQYVGNAGCIRVRGGRVDYAGCGGHVVRDAPADAASIPCTCGVSSADAGNTTASAGSSPPGRGAPREPAVVLVAHRPHGRSDFREVRVQANAPPTTINVNVSSMAECDEWCSRFSKGFWIAT